MDQRLPICGCQAHQQEGAKIGARPRFSGMKTSGGSVSGLIGCRDDEAMKIKKTVNPSILFVSVLLLVNQCHGQSNVVCYGVNSSSISVSFVDPNLSAIFLRFAVTIFFAKILRFCVAFCAAWY